MECISQIVTKRFAYIVAVPYLTSFGRINLETRQDDLTPKDKSLLKFVDDTIYFYSDLEEMTLYYGIDSPNLFDDSDIFKSEVVLFASTNISSFASKDHILVIRCPKGTSKMNVKEEGVEIPSLKGLGNYLLPSNSTLRLTEICGQEKYIEFVCELLPNRPDEIEKLELSNTIAMIEYLRHAKDNEEYYDVRRYEDPTGKSYVEDFIIVMDQNGQTRSRPIAELTTGNRNYKGMVAFRPFEFFEPRSIVQRALK